MLFFLNANGSLVQAQQRAPSVSSPPSARFRSQQVAAHGAGLQQMASSASNPPSVKSRNRLMIVFKMQQVARIFFFLKAGRKQKRTWLFFVVPFFFKKKVTLNH